MLDRARALLLLSECDGDEIWSIDQCRKRGVPASWIDELIDGYESGFRSDSQTIYHAGQVVNQYEGVLASDLACKLGEYLGVEVERIRSSAGNRRQLVKQIREAIEEE